MYRIKVSLMDGVVTKTNDQLIQNGRILYCTSAMVLVEMS